MRPAIALSRRPALVTSSEVTISERWHNLVAIWSGARLHTRAHDEIRLVAYGFKPDANYEEGRGAHGEVVFSKVIRKAG
jgi:hypothetical protein